MKFIFNFINSRINFRASVVKIVSNMGWLFFDKILRIGVGMFIGIWIARYLGPQQFGLLSFATAFSGLFAAIGALGLHSIVVRDIVVNPNDAHEILGTSAVMQLIGGLVAYCLCLVTIYYLRYDDVLALTIVSIIGLTMLFKISDIAVFWFESQVQSKYTVWVKNIVFLIFAGVKVVLILQNAPVTVFALATFIEVVFTAFLLLVVLDKLGPPLKTFRVKFARAKTLLKDSWPLALSAIAILIYMKIDQVMLGQMIGDEAVGVYSAAVRISEAFYLVPTVIVSSVFPAVLRAKKRSEELYYMRLQQMFDFMVVIAIVVALPLTFFAEPIIILLFGEVYADAGATLAVHIWAAVFVFLGGASRPWFIAEQLQRLHLKRSAIGAIMNICLNLLLIPYFQLYGAAVATILSYAYVALISDLFNTKTRAVFTMKIKSFNIFRSVNNIFAKI